MKTQNSKLKTQNPKLRIYILLLSFLFLASHFLFLTPAFTAKWGGVDESIVERYAEEYGRAPRDPLINTDQGDLLLFIFLLGGAVGGFFVGYYWRVLTEDRSKKTLFKQRGRQDVLL